MSSYNEVEKNRPFLLKVTDGPHETSYSLSMGLVTSVSKYVLHLAKAVDEVQLMKLTNRLMKPRINTCQYPLCAPSAKGRESNLPLLIILQGIS